MFWKFKLHLVTLMHLQILVVGVFQHRGRDTGQEVQTHPDFIASQSLIFLSLTQPEFAASILVGWVLWERVLCLVVS